MIVKDLLVNGNASITGTLRVGGDILASKSYVDDAISTNTAVFRGTFATRAELYAYNGTKTNNDYAVVSADESNNKETWRYKYDGNSWKAEYKINETALTVSQLNALNSGITAETVSNLTTTVGTKLNISGDNGTAKGVSNLINKLNVGDSTPVDEDYYVAQYAGGGTAITSFYRRPLKALWEYIKNKLSSTFGLGGTKTDNAIVRFNGTGGAIQNTGVTIDDNNNITMVSTGTTGTSNKIIFNGSTDGADIYYYATASDQGNLVLNTRDDTNCYIQFANNGIFHSYISTNDGVYHGNIDNGKIYTKNDTVSINNKTLNRQALYITGETFGNNTTDLKTAGKLSFGDAGPQIIFSETRLSDASSQSLALIYTDHDDVRSGVSLHLVSNQPEAWFVSHSIQALSRLRIPTSTPSNPKSGDIWIS